MGWGIFRGHIAFSSLLCVFKVGVKGCSRRMDAVLSAKPVLTWNFEGYIRKNECLFFILCAVVNVVRVRFGALEAPTS